MRLESSGASGCGHSTSARIRSARSGASGADASAVEVVRHLGVRRLAAGRDHRLVEVAVAHLAREVRQHLVAALHRGLEVVEHLAEVAGHVAGQVVGELQAAVEDRHDGGALRGHALLGEGDPVARPPRAPACDRAP